jgi:hypothetical protein
MRVRAAGALLLAPVLSIVDSVLDRFTYQRGSFADQAEGVLRALLWVPEGADGSQPVVQAVARDVVLLVVVVVALIGMAGLRAGRVLVPLAAIGLAVLYLPSVIWPVFDPSFDRFPPDWVRDYQPWFFVDRASAVMWIVVLVIVALLAATSRAQERAVPAAAGPYPTGPAGPAGPYAAGPTSRPPEPVPPSHDPDRTLVQKETRP